MVQDLHTILQIHIFGSSRLILKLVILYYFTLNKPMGYISGKGMQPDFKCTSN